MPFSNWKAAASATPLDDLWFHVFEQHMSEARRLAAWAETSEKPLAKRVKEQVKDDRKAFMEKKAVEAAEAAEAGQLDKSWGMVRMLRNMKKATSRGAPWSTRRDAQPPRAKRRQKLGSRSFSTSSEADAGRRR